MKSSSSPCPLDKISIIFFNRCPYLRSLLTKIIRVFWESGCLGIWKNACIVLVHKKGNNDDSAIRAVPRKFSWGVLSFHLLTKMGVADDIWGWSIKFGVLYAMKLWRYGKA